MQWRIKKNNLRGRQHGQEPREDPNSIKYHFKFLCDAMQAQLTKNKTYELRLDSAKDALSIAKRELENLRRASGME